MTAPHPEEITLHFQEDAQPQPIETGTPVYGETTDGEPITLYVTHVADNGTITIGPRKP